MSPSGEYRAVLKRTVSGKWVVIASVTLLVVILLLVWTLQAPLVLNRVSDLSNTVFSSANVVSNSTVTDTSGSYQFAFGFDYNSNVTAGSSAEVVVYAALVSEGTKSPFFRGAALQVQSSSLLIDGVVDTGARFVERSNSQIDSFYFQFINTNLGLGEHNMTARLLLTTIDVGYIGYYQGTSFLVTIPGSFNITS
jgi:hypothetical protein